MFNPGKDTNIASIRLFQIQNNNKNTYKHEFLKPRPPPSKENLNFESRDDGRSSSLSLFFFEEKKGFGSQAPDVAFRNILKANRGQNETKPLNS